MTLQTEILSTATSDFLKQLFFLKSYNSVLNRGPEKKGSVEINEIISVYTTYEHTL